MLKQRKLEWWERYTLEGEARLLRRLLERRFGALPTWVDQHLATASEENLIRWGHGRQCAQTNVRKRSNFELTVRLIGRRSPPAPVVRNRH